MKIVGEILFEYALQMGLTIGSIIVFGLLIALCNKAFYKVFGNKATIVCYATGFIGTPVHELSHALFCLIFGHKIKEIKLFQINSSDGTLGYVNHSYNPKNLYQRAGNFFIGIAPIIVISALLYGISLLLVPSFMHLLIDNLRQVIPATSLAAFGNAFSGMIGIFKMYVGNGLFWVFVVIGCFFSLHMTLSTADIKGAASGIVFVLVAFLLVDVILGVINLGFLGIFTKGVLAVATVLNAFLLLSLLISAAATLLAFILKKTVGKKLFLR